MNSSRKDVSSAPIGSEEMLGRSSSWTLACDNALLNRLKAFSEKLTENSQEISKECDKMSTDVTQLNYKLLNLTNEFLMLSNTQFVENRVEEFEEFSASLSSTSGNATVSYKTKAETEAELISKMKQAIQTGLAACNERKVQNGNSVNRFKMKRPHLIGSPKFFSSKFCGLVDESRRFVPPDRISLCDSDTISVGQGSENDFIRSGPNPVVTFTMPPQPVFPAQVPGTKSNRSSLFDDDYQSQISTNNDYQASRTEIPASPSNSNKSSSFSAKSASISRENMPRSITDDLNKLYSSFAPPPNAGLLDDDSDDDFKPTASGGRLFDDDDDLFGEKELFPSGQKNSDFFGRSNPSKIAAPVFSVPPPVQSHRLQTPQPTFSGEQTLVGPQPKTNDLPNKNSTCDVSSQNGSLIRDDEKTVPDTVGPSRAKLLPGAVSMFGGLPPPVFNDDGILQAAGSFKNTTTQPKSKQDTQNSIASSVRSGISLMNDRDSNTQPSQPKQENLHTDADVQTSSQPRSSLFSSGRPSTETENISRGSLSGSGNVNNSVSRKAPVSSLFVDDSSDEDIFSSTKKQITRSQAARNSASDNNHSSESTKYLAPNVLSASKKIEEPKYLIKKSIFEDSESDDDLFSTKQTKIPANKSLFTDRKVPKTQLATKVSHESIKKSSLFSEESDSDTDLFGNKKSGKYFPKVSAAMDTLDSESSTQDTIEDDQRGETIGTSIKKSKNRMSDVVDAAIIAPIPEKKSMGEEQEKQKIGEPKLSKSVGSKISEKIKAMENNKSRSQKHDDLNANDNDNNATEKSNIPRKPKLSVKSLALSLNINPLAMKVGAKPPKPGQASSSNPSTPDLEAKTPPINNEDTTSPSLLPESDILETVTKEKDPVSVTPTSRESVKSLALSLNINPLAMKVGAKPPKPGQASSSNPSTPDPETNSSPTTLASNSDILSEGLDKTVNEESASPSVSRNSVKSLALNLKINPLAMKVGAKPHKHDGSSTPSTPEQDTDNVQAIKENAESISNQEATVDSSQEPAIMTEPDSTTPTSRNSEDNFFHIIKTRPKIQQKRRPPSRVFLKSLLAVHDSIETADVEADDDEITENVHSSNALTKITTSDDASEDTTDELPIAAIEHIKSADVNDSKEKTTINITEPPALVDDQDTLKLETQSVNHASENEMSTCSSGQTSEKEDIEEPLDNQNPDLFENLEQITNDEPCENVESASSRDIKGAGSLFETPLPDGDSDEDLFSSKVGRKSFPPSSQQPVEGTSKSSSQPSKVVNHNSTKSIFEDSDSDNDLFATTKSSKVNNNNNDDSLFSTQSKPKLQTAKKVSSLFADDSDSDSDLFKSKPTKSHENKHVKDDTSESSASVKVYGGKSSFFDSSDEN
ncbi:unnamed protein product [Orchesella dallaii]|uniref:WASH complex subunit FAM21 n=1 Tax=Orchesella dallaii TaxID=48710 RepID=A0ABP1QUE8_9HEXA